uniref:Baculoviral IAP repeat-containing protein 2 n=1 Tax=Phallusia mammillata TaxID=59560 RepID=A0A6F9D8D2_9ASCI|nr:baculoviral IAP repeat-containing protein 2 [Phallusia mammillata]
MALQVASDGRVMRFANDPPGQETTYIFPGDVEVESYRVATFQKFLPATTVSVKELSQNGFFYTGYRDRIKCYRCGHAVEDMRVPVDKQRMQSWHDIQCQFAADTGRANRPTDTTPSPTVTVQPKTSGSQPSISPLLRKMTAGELLQRGPVHLSQAPSFNVPLSVVQSTRAVEKNHSNAPVFAHSRYSLSTARAHQERERGSVDAFPCTSPKNPHMADERTRLATFKFNWPNHINATPQELAQAGLYFLGERDRLKCWYCNKGFHNWERNDVPWVEHAKHSPNCEFLLQCQGPEFVSRVNNGEGHDICGTNWAEACQREEERLLAESIEKEIQESEIVAAVKDLGFENATIRKALTRCRKNNATVNSTVQLVDECLKENETHVESDTISRLEEDNTIPVNTTVEFELQQLQYERQCKVCLLKEASVMLLPCHHLASCDGCRESSQKCPICKTLVENMVP